ncbi:MAG: F0F1 ATP synthase subunit epsilon [Amoebophilaceae bacterium]|nr:F0F1 ATP synthase subunit epsilon [Amoebophilaceae bacterium]
MNLSIIAPHGKLFQGKVSHITLPGEVGAFQVYINHAPLVSALCAGNVTYTIGTAVAMVEIKSGFVSVANNKVHVVCEPIAVT